MAWNLLRLSNRLPTDGTAELLPPMQIPQNSLIVKSGLSSTSSRWSGRGDVVGDVRPPAPEDDGAARSERARRRIKHAEGKPIAGGQLFRKYLKYLLNRNRCQEDFERGWVAKEAAAAAATKATEDQAAKATAEANKDGESALYSDEYYAAQKAKRQGLGLIKSIGELFKLQMLTERIMHGCVKKLVGNVQNPDEEEMESLC